MSWYFPTPASFHCGWFAAGDNMLTEGLYAAAATFVAFSVRGPHGSRGVGHAAMFTRRLAVQFIATSTAHTPTCQPFLNAQHQVVRVRPAWACAAAASIKAASHRKSISEGA